MQLAEEELAAMLEGFLRPALRGYMLRYHETAWARLPELGDKVLPGGGTARREVRLAIQARTASPPQPQWAGRWRREMSSDDLAEFEAVAGDLLAILGYELDTKTPLSPPNASHTPMAAPE